MSWVAAICAFDTAHENEKEATYLMLEWIVRSAPRTKNKFSLGRNSSSFNSLIFQPRNVNLRNVKNEKLKQKILLFNKQLQKIKIQDSVF